MRRNPRRCDCTGLALGAMVLSIVLLAAACGSSKSKGHRLVGAGEVKIVVGAKNFPAAQVISQLYGQALAAKGFKVSYKDVGADRADVPGAEERQHRSLRRVPGHVAHVPQGHAERPTRPR